MRLDYSPSDMVVVGESRCRGSEGMTPYRAESPPEAAMVLLWTFNEACLCVCRCASSRGGCCCCCWEIGPELALLRAMTTTGEELCERDEEDEEEEEREEEDVDPFVSRSRCAWTKTPARLASRHSSAETRTKPSGTTGGSWFWL